MEFRPARGRKGLRYAVGLWSVRLALVLLLAACAGGGSGPWRSRVLREHPLVGTRWDLHTREPVAFDAMVAELAAARFVLLGEKHDNPDHHRLEARVIGALAERGEHPGVAFEMLRRSLAPELARAKTVADVRAVWRQGGWGDWEGYRPVVEAALAGGGPLAAADLSRDEQHALGRGGAAALSAQRRQALDLDTPLPDERRRAFAKEIRDSHCGHAPEAEIPHMIDVQRARDAQLARALVALAQRAVPAALVTGAEHARRDRGVPTHLTVFAPHGRVVSVLLAEVDPDARDLASDLEKRFGAGVVPFDYVWFTPRVDALDPCEKFRKQLEKMGESDSSGG